MGAMATMHWHVNVDACMRPLKTNMRSGRLDDHNYNNMVNLGQVFIDTLKSIYNEQ